MHTDCGTESVSGGHIPLNIDQESCAKYPLRGVTVLLVEDSRLASEVFRVMCMRSGARIRRADSIRSAMRHLQTYRPNVAIIDMGLPDGSGASLIEKITRGGNHMPAVLGLSGDDSRIAEASEAGAAGFILKPLESISAFQEAVLTVLPPEMRPKGLRVVNNRGVSPDLQALQDDLCQLETLLQSDLDARQHGYAVQFLSSLARSAADPVLDGAARVLSQDNSHSTISKVRDIIFGYKYCGNGMRIV